jgi:hypothetical protein
MPDTAVLQQPRPAASSMPWHCQAAASRLIERITRTDKQVAALANKYATAIHDPMQRQRSRHSPCRESTMVDLERDWRRNLPPESRLGLVVDWEKSRSRLKGLTISDARLTGFPFNLTNWPIDHTEFGLGALIISSPSGPMM